MRLLFHFVLSLWRAETVLYCYASKYCKYYFTVDSFPQSSDLRPDYHVPAARPTEPESLV